MNKFKNCLKVLLCIVFIFNLMVQPAYASKYGGGNRQVIVFKINKNNFSIMSDIIDEKFEEITEGIEAQKIGILSTHTKGTTIGTQYYESLRDKKSFNDAKNNPMGSNLSSTSHTMFTFPAYKLKYSGSNGEYVNLSYENYRMKNTIDSTIVADLNRLTELLAPPAQELNSGNYLQGFQYYNNTNGNGIEDAASEYFKLLGKIADAVNKLYPRDNGYLFDQYNAEKDPNKRAPSNYATFTYKGQIITFTKMTNLSEGTINVKINRGSSNVYRDLGNFKCVASTGYVNQKSEQDGFQGTIVHNGTKYEIDGFNNNHSYIYTNPKLDWRDIFIQSGVNYYVNNISGFATISHKTNILTEMIVGFFNIIAGGLEAIIGADNPNDVVLNENSRDAKNGLYTLGIYPSSWNTKIFAFATFFEIVAYMLVFAAIIRVLMKQTASNFNAISRYSVMNDIKNIALAAILLAIIYPVIYLLMVLNYNFVSIFGAISGGNIINSLVSGINATSNPITALIVSFTVLFLKIYISLIYIFRSLLTVIAIILMPLAVVMIAFDRKDIFTKAFTELTSNIFIQTVHALSFVLIMNFATFTSLIGQIAVALAIIPITEAIRSTMLRSSSITALSSTAASMTSRAQKGTTRAISKSAKDFGSGAYDEFKNYGSENSSSEQGKSSNNFGKQDNNREFQNINNKNIGQGPGSGVGTTPNTNSLSLSDKEDELITLANSRMEGYTDSLSAYNDDLSQADQTLFEGNLNKEYDKDKIDKNIYRPATLSSKGLNSSVSQEQMEKLIKENEVPGLDKRFLNRAKQDATNLQFASSLGRLTGGATGAVFKGVKHEHENYNKMLENMSSSDHKQFSMIQTENDLRNVDTSYLASTAGLNDAIMVDDKESDVKLQYRYNTEYMDTQTLKEYNEIGNILKSEEPEHQDRKEYYKSVGFENIKTIKDNNEREQMLVQFNENAFQNMSLENITTIKNSNGDKAFRMNFKRDAESFEITPRVDIDPFQRPKR